MMAKLTLVRLIKDESEYLASQKVGSEEYNASYDRLTNLAEKLAVAEKLEDEKKDRFVRFILEVVKVVGTFGFWLFGLVVITAQERDITYTGAMKALLNNFIPGKMK